MEANIKLEVESLDELSDSDEEVDEESDSSLGSEHIDVQAFLNVSLETDVKHEEADKESIVDGQGNSLPLCSQRSLSLRLGDREKTCFSVGAPNLNIKDDSSVYLLPDMKQEYKVVKDKEECSEDNDIRNAETADQFGVKDENEIKGEFEAEEDELHLLDSRIVKKQNRAGSESHVQHYYNTLLPCTSQDAICSFDFSEYGSEKGGSNLYDGFSTPSDQQECASRRNISGAVETSRILISTSGKLSNEASACVPKPKRKYRTKEKKKFRCHICGKNFYIKSKLKLHLRSHTGEKPFQCQHCGKQFSHKHNLVSHLRTHTGEKPYECQYCFKRYSERSKLSIHLRFHTGEKPFICQHCDRQFSRGDLLSRHVRVHSGEKPFKCPHCEKHFSQNGVLHRHIRIHTGEKPHQCLQCGSQFSEKCSLTAHLRIHMAEKPFKCLICPKQFCHKSSLNTHIVRIHRREKP